MKRNFPSILVAACAAAIRGDAAPGNAITPPTPRAFDHRSSSLPPASAFTGMSPREYGVRYRWSKRKARAAARRSGVHPANPLRA